MVLSRSQHENMSKEELIQDLTKYKFKLFQQHKCKTD